MGSLLKYKQCVFYYLYNVILSFGGSKVFFIKGCTRGRNMIIEIVFLFSELFLFEIFV